MVDFSANTVAHNKNGWWYVKGGKVQFSYNGFGYNSNGYWYCENGKVTFNKNSVIQDTTGAIGAKGTWWYVTGSKVQTSYTGVANYSNANGWWYIKNGKVDFSVNTIAQNKNGWWYVKGGKVQFNYTGLGTNSNGKWYCENGKVTFKKNSVIHDTTGAIGTKGTWWYVTGSKVQTSYTGVADYSNTNGWWYIKNGKVDFTFNGVAANKNGSWVVKSGKVNFSYNGTYTYNGQTYTVKNGKATLTSCSHVYSSSVTKAATCTTSGIRTYTCTKCGATYTETIAVTGHNYTSTVTKAATCSSAGIRTYTCSSCGASYTQTIAATGEHTWEAVYTTKEEDVYEVKQVCNYDGCGEYFDSVDEVCFHIQKVHSGGATYSAKKVKTGTTTVETLEYYECSVCGATKEP
ncbi:MAG: hypothetical protein LIO96_06575 [Lachnospiraceae bacterium]|nr:hypothetical protein [Lachnospiraceae bacterium]